MLNALRRAVLLVCLVLGLTGCGGVRQALLSQEIRAYTDHSSWEEGNLYIFFGGTGVVDSDARAGSSIAVVANGELFLFDCGPGSTRVLQQGHVPLEWSRAIFFTHLHSDHFGDLGQFTLASQLSGRASPLTIYGPEGTQEMASGFQQAYARDLEFRIAQHPDHLSKELGEYEVVELDGEPVEQVVYEDQGIRISALAVDHTPVTPALAYKVEAGGRVVVISGDTSYHKPLASFAEGADVLIHEAMDKELALRMADVFASQDAPRTGQLIHEALPNHSSPADAGNLAREARASRLVLTHLSPPLLTRRWRKDVLNSARQQYPGPVSLAEDGMTIILEAQP
jgi:ribonuclease Z